MQPDTNRATRRLILVVFICFVSFFIILFGGEWLYRFFTTGKLVVTTNDPNTAITVSSTPGATADDQGFFDQAKGSLSRSMHTGTYYVTAKTNLGSVSKSVTVKAHTTTNVALKVPQPNGVEPVAYGNVQNIVADGAHMAYLSPGTGINYLSAGNTDTIIPNTRTFVSVSWASPDYGIGLDQSKGFYVVNGNSISPLTSPVSAISSLGTTYAVAPDHTIYLASGSSVYRGTDHGNFQKIYGNRPVGSGVVASNSEVAILDTSFGTSTPQVTVISTDGKAVSKTFTSHISSWSQWSPGGKYIAVNSGGTGVVLDAALHEVAAIPQSSFTQAGWLNDSTLFYSVGSQLWSYDVTSQASQLIANTPLDEQIMSIAAGQDGAYVYLTTLNPGNNQIDAARRVGLKAQAVPSVLYSLQAILPLQETGYSIGLRNFAGTPAIVVQANSAGSEASDLQAAKKALQPLVDTSGLQFVATVSP